MNELFSHLLASAPWIGMCIMYMNERQKLDWSEVDGWCAVAVGVDDEMQVSLTLKKKRGLAYVSVCVLCLWNCSMSDLSKQNILLNVCIHTITTGFINS